MSNPIPKRLRLVVSPLQTVPIEQSFQAFLYDWATPIATGGVSQLTLRRGSGLAIGSFTMGCLQVPAEPPDLMTLAAREDRDHGHLAKIAEHLTDVFERGESIPVDLVSQGRRLAGHAVVVEYAWHGGRPVDASFGFEMSLREVTGPAGELAGCT